MIPFEEHLKKYEGKNPPSIPVRKKASNTAVWVIGIFAVLAIIASISEKSAEKAAPTCKSDWTQCKDNSDMANNFKGWFHVKYTCERRATELAKYGTPEWPSLAFSSFYPGKDYANGIVTVIEPDAKFQNGFGAMAHARVTCTFDLRADKVTNVSIEAR